MPNEWQFCCLMLEKPKKVFSLAYVHNYMGLGFLDQFEQQHLYVIFFLPFNYFTFCIFSKTDYLGKIRLSKRTVSCRTIRLYFNINFVSEMQTHQLSRFLELLFKFTMNRGYQTTAEDITQEQYWLTKNSAYCCILFPFSFLFWSCKRKESVDILYLFHMLFQEHYYIFIFILFDTLHLLFIYNYMCYRIS